MERRLLRRDFARRSGDRARLAPAAEIRSADGRIDHALRLCAPTSARAAAIGCRVSRRVCVAAAGAARGRPAALARRGAQRARVRRVGRLGAPGRADGARAGGRRVRRGAAAAGRVPARPPRRGRRVLLPLQVCRQRHARRRQLADRPDAARRHRRRGHDEQHRVRAQPQPRAAARRAPRRPAAPRGRRGARRQGGGGGGAAAALPAAEREKISCVAHTATSFGGAPIGHATARAARGCCIECTLHPRCTAYNWRAEPLANNCALLGEPGDARGNPLSTAGSVARARTG